MQPEIKTLSQTLLVGMYIETSMANDKTRELWQKFMPQRHLVSNWDGTHFFSMQKFPADLDFKDVTPQTTFQKWAAVPVDNLDNIPAGMTGYTLEGGKYAVFLYQGTPDMFPETWKYIFGEWLPASDYELDNREHFEILGVDYRPDDPNAQEEIWIPIR